MLVKTAATLFGDPHFFTLDGLSYVFNGLGEYWLLKSAPFWVQVRTDFAWSSSNGTISNATVLSAIAAQGWFHSCGY
jgi:sushi domain-containing protein 2